MWVNRFQETASFLVLISLQIIIGLPMDNIGYFHNSTIRYQPAQSKRSAMKQNQLSSQGFYHVQKHNCEQPIKRQLNVQDSSFHKQSFPNKLNLIEYSHSATGAKSDPCFDPNEETVLTAPAYSTVKIPCTVHNVDFTSTVVSLIQE